MVTMTKPNEWRPPAHRLRTVTARLWLPSLEEPPTPWTGIVQGGSPTRRAPLWSESNLWDEDVAQQGNEVADWFHHILLCAVQDQPNSQERLLFSLTGGLGQQDPLF
jgi:hypothetical protein